MERSNSIQNDLFKEKLDISLAIDIAEWSIICDILSSMMTEVLIILDFERKVIQCMPNNNQILNGHTSESSKEIGYDIIEKLIHPKDISFVKEIFHIMKESLCNDELPADQVNYFSFLLSMKNSLSPNKKLDYLMNYVKLKPLLVNNEIRFGICTLSASVIRKQNYQLNVYYKNMDYSEYSFNSKKWKYCPYSPLSKRHQEMLIWAQQGLSLKETADKMNLADKTIESIRGSLFEKFGVNTIEQAIQYASNRRLIYHSPSIPTVFENKLIKLKNKYSM